MENLGADIFGRKEPMADTSVMKQISPAGNPAKIKVIGVGGGGGNAVQRMIDSGFSGVEFWVMNTDLQVLSCSSAKNKLQLGVKSTEGLGAGGEPALGEKAAEEAQQEITAALEDADMVFVTAGMGGGTGTGAAPIIARTAKDLGILTVGVVTKPFSFEGKRRMAQAVQGIEKLQKEVDSLLVIPNDKLLEVADNKMGVQNAFVIVDEVLLRGVKGISDIITIPGLINVDFADVKSVMKDSGSAIMGIGVDEGEGRAVKAAEIAINSNLLETSINGASGLIVNIKGGPDMTLYELTDAITMINNAVKEDAKVIIGTSIDEKSQGAISITVIATGIDLKPQTPVITTAGSMTTDIDKIFTGMGTGQKTPAPTPSPLPPLQPFSPGTIEIPSFLRK